MSTAVIIAASLATLGTLAAIATSGGGRATGREGATAAELPPLPSWVPEGTSLSRSPPPNTDTPEHPIVRVGAWYWTDVRTFPGDGSRVGANFRKGVPVWKLLTRLHAPPKSAQLLIVRIWIRAVTGNGETTWIAGQQIDIVASLATPLVARIVSATGKPLAPDMKELPMNVRLTRNANGTIDVDAAKSGPVAANEAAMVLEFAFRA